MTRLCLTVLALALWAFNAYDCQPLQDSELSRSELQTQVVNFDHEDDDDTVDEEYLNDEAEDEVLAALEDVQHHSNNNLKSRKLQLQRTRTYAKAVIPIEFQEFTKKKPRKKNLKTSRLLRKMGGDFDAKWMSVDTPSQLLSVEMSERQMEQLVQQVSGLNLEKELQSLVGSGVDEVAPGTSAKEMISVFEQWLVKRSSCPVTYHWDDMGEYFWPRWIKKGQCQGQNQDPEDQNGETSAAALGLAGGIGCSWPKGMHCVPGETKTIHLLRWHCRRRSAAHRKGGKGGKYKCKWYKVPYPVVENCRCACQ